MPVTLPSLNNFVHLHWAQYHRKRKEWGQWVMVAKTQAHVYGHPKLQRVRIEIERRCNRPIHDDDNLEASRKMLIDAIVENGILAGDTREVIVECTITQVKVAKRDAETVVRIYPITATSPIIASASLTE